MAQKLRAGVRGNNVFMCFDSNYFMLGSVCSLHCSWMLQQGRNRRWLLYTVRLSEGRLLPRRSPYIFGNAANVCSHTGFRNCFTDGLLEPIGSSSGGSDFNLQMMLALFAHAIIIIQQLRPAHSEQAESYRHFDN